MQILKTIKKAMSRHRSVVLFTGIAVFLLAATPALAVSLGVSPPSVEFDIPADGNTQVEFVIYNLTGDLQISLEDIPLRVEPEIIPVATGEEGYKVSLTFYGDESLGSQVFEGKIRFLGISGGNVAAGIKVKAIINHIATGQPLPSAATPAGPEEPAEPAEPAGEAPTPPRPPSAPQTEGFPVIPVAGIAAGAAILITIIVLVVRRRRSWNL